MQSTHHITHLNFISLPNATRRDFHGKDIASSSSSQVCRALSQKRWTEARTRRSTVRCGLGFGFITNRSSDTNMRDSLPSPEAVCACASEKAYGKCCRRFHTAQATPRLAEELLRSRYSAYAYRLPSYIMKTTHSSLAELDRRKWKREIVAFCREYRFVGGVDIIEQQMTGPYTTRILFR